MRNTLVVPVLAFELLAGTAMAQNLAFPSQALKVNGPTTNDLARASEVDGVKRLRKTDEEHTNEQAVVQLFADGRLGIYVEMRSSELDHKITELEGNIIRLGEHKVEMSKGMRDDLIGKLKFLK